MEKLSIDQYIKAREFMNTAARGIDKAMFNYEFENGNDTEVISELRKFQNSDGGFGKGLEPDLRCEQSSALATTVALQYLSKVNSNQKQELIAESFRFLEATYNNNENGWEIIPQAANLSPRADWWNYAGILPDWGNPNAEILGYLYEYPDLLSSNLNNIQQHLTRYAIDYLHNRCKLTEMHELFCFIRLTDRIPDDLRDNFAGKLTKFMENCVIKNPAERNGYCAVPLQIVDTPESRFLTTYSDVIPSDLDQLIKSQTEDGSWEPNWSWGRYEDDWQNAKREWKGYITLLNLRLLKSFSRIEK